MADTLKLFLVLAILKFIIVSIVAAEAENDIEVNLDIKQWTVDKQFLSVAMGAGSVKRKEWTTSNFTTPRMLNLARALSPAMLRVGGTRGDYLIFNKTQYEKISPPAINFTMTTEDWDAMNEFTHLAGWEFVFGLNVFLRNKSLWNSSNARDLFEYTRSKNYLVNWELGNELNLDRYSNFITPEQLAEDFGIMHALLKECQLDYQFTAGPDVATRIPPQYLIGFLKSLKPGILKAVTWHHYYLHGNMTVLPDMFNVDILDTFIFRALQTSNVSFTLSPDTELWLGETSSCSGGGTRVLSSSFVAGFMWLDKLGVAALTNHSRVFRQEFAGASYSLLDSSFNPLPDYWLSVLHKRLVGTVVLDVKGALEPGRHVRVYAHCARQPLYSAGDVTLLVLNVHTYDTTATLLSPSLAAAPRDIYLLSPPGNTTNVLSKEVALNGVVLSLVNNTVLPDLPPLTQSATPTLHLPALSFGFYVFKGVQAKACL